MRKNITLMMVDDHHLVRHGVLSLLELQDDIDVVGEAASGEQALEMIEALTPDIVLMDLMLPRMSGVEATRKIKQLSPGTHVIVLTSYHDDEHIFPALRAGALSYVLKDVGPDELVDTIRKTAQGEAILSPRIAARLIQEIQGIKKEATSSLSDLSERELEVLRLIARGDSNAIIAEKLVISEKTVKGHVSNILGKLHMLDRTQAAAFAWEQGVVRRIKDA